MKAANLRQSDMLPDNIIFFPNHAGFAGRPTVLSPSTVRVSNIPAEDRVAQSRLTELFAMKREEKAPENYVRDALEVFHRRNASSAARILTER